MTHLQPVQDARMTSARLRALETLAIHGRSRVSNFTGHSDHPDDISRSFMWPRCSWMFWQTARWLVAQGWATWIAVDVAAEITELGRQAAAYWLADHEEQR